MYDGTFFHCQAFCLNNLFYCLSLLYVISRDENLLLYKLDFYIFGNLTRCKTQYRKIPLMRPTPPPPEYTPPKYETQLTYRI